MATATEVLDAEFKIIQSNPVSLYDVTDAHIADLRTELTGVLEYQEVAKGIAKVRGLRTRIEAARKRLKADSLAWGRRVDSEAKRIIDQLESIEEPLKLLKQSIDDAKEQQKAAIEAARVAEVERRIKAFKDLEYTINPFLVAEMTLEEYADELKLACDAHEVLLANRKLDAEAAEEVRLKAIADEAQRIETLRIEREAFEAERAALAAEKAEYEAKQESERSEQAEKARLEQADRDAIQIKIDEQNRIDRERMDAERAELQKYWDGVAEQKRLEAERVEAEQQAAQNAQYEAAEAARVERLRVETEQAEAARLEALNPDIEKIRAFGNLLRLLTYPSISTIEGVSFLSLIEKDITVLAVLCEEFGS